MQLKVPYVVQSGPSARSFIMISKRLVARMSATAYKIYAMRADSKLRKITCIFIAYLFLKYQVTRKASVDKSISN